MNDTTKPALLRADDIRAREETGAHPWNPSSELRGTRLGTATGLQRTGVNLLRVAPGKESFIYHTHYYEEEWLYILSGRGIAEIDGVEHEVGPGDFMGFATPSVPHVLRNTFDEECTYLMGGEDKPIDVVSYPELEKRFLLMQTDKGTEFYELGEPIKPYGKAD